MLGNKPNLSPLASSNSLKNAESEARNRRDCPAGFLRSPLRVSVYKRICVKRLDAIAPKGFSPIAPLGIYVQVHAKVSGIDGLDAIAPAGIYIQVRDRV